MVVVGNIFESTPSKIAEFVALTKEYQREEQE